MFQDSQPTQEEASLKVHRSRSVRRVEVTTDGRNLVSHAGTALLCELADRTGLTRASRLRHLGEHPRPGPSCSLTSPSPSQTGVTA